MRYIGHFRKAQIIDDSGCCRVRLDLTPQVYANISSTVYTHVPTLEALRAGTFRSIPLDNLEGLITFPSFHTAGAIMFIWALPRGRTGSRTRSGLIPLALTACTAALLPGARSEACA